MNGVYDAFAAGTDLSPVAARKLHERGFVVIPGPILPADMERVTAAYDATLGAVIALWRSTP